MTNDEEGSSRPNWKRYPFRLSESDEELVFPQAEGLQDGESNTWYVAGRLRGRSTGRLWAFLVVFTANDIHRRLRADFYTLALFDIGTGDYGTFTELDFPKPPKIRRSYRLSAATDRLDLVFRSAAGNTSWTHAHDEAGTALPFAYRVNLRGRDDRGRAMHVDLELDTRKPPMPVGGEEYGGVKTCIGQFGTHSYFQSDVCFRGTLVWGDVTEEVDGDSGWIDRQWARRYLGAYNDRRSSRYRHEWRQIHLDNGYEMSAWLQFDRHRHNRIIPFSGVTAATRDGRVITTTAFEVDRLSYVRDPKHVRPLYSLTDGPAWLADRYRLRVPEWELDVVSDPLVPAPAHAFPIEYWSGPTRIRGTMWGEPVGGIGFHERTRIFARDFELVDVLRDTLRNLPADVFPPDGPGALESANLVWEIDGFLSHDDREGALRYLGDRIRPLLHRLASPHREHVLVIAADLAAVILRWWVRPPGGETHA